MAQFLDESSKKVLVSSFILSRLDYCNSLLANLPNESINKLQRCQNNAARLVLKKKKSDHVTPMFLHLHWLPVKARIEYKIAILTYKCMNNSAPNYLSSFLTPYTPSRSLRSESKNLLRVPTYKYKKYGERSFFFYAPHIWNELPLTLKNSPTEAQFKSSLKTFLFQKHVK